MGCADYRIYCDGDSDSDGNDLLYGVLIKKASWSLIPGRFVVGGYNYYYFFDKKMSISADFCLYLQSIHDQNTTILLDRHGLEMLKMAWIAHVFLFL